MAALIFLSHIHEESNLAQEIQKAIEDEFGGFVEVFVSSDGKTISAGANFLKRIEDGLINCIGAIYLISPISVKRNWINFELGAIWVRNIMSVKGSGPEIPTIPFCHSGMTPSQLPMPLINLNAIQANISSQLEFAFRSIQVAVGGKGNLKTNFDTLAQSIISFEKRYTVGGNLVKLFTLIGYTNKEINDAISMCKILKKRNVIIQLGSKDNSLISELKSLETSGLNGYLIVKLGSASIGMNQSGTTLRNEVEILISTDVIIDYEQLLMQKIK